MKKTDLEKHLAKKIEGRLKTKSVSQRFGKGSASSAAPSTPKQQESAPAAPAAGKLVAVSVRLPAALAQCLRSRAVGREGGISALVAEAVEQWLATTAGGQAEKP